MALTRHVRYAHFMFTKAVRRLSVTKQERNPQTRLIVKTYNIDMVPRGSYTAIAVGK